MTSIRAKRVGMARSFMQRISASIKPCQARQRKQASRLCAGFLQDRFKVLNAYGTGEMDVAINAADVCVQVIVLLTGVLFRYFMRFLAGFDFSGAAG
jgi:hypothetical protein